MEGESRLYGVSIMCACSSAISCDHNRVTSVKLSVLIDSIELTAEKQTKEKKNVF